MNLSNTFPEPSGSDENPPVSKWTADESQSTEGLDSRATGGELFTIPETKSPRLLWMERHHLTTANYTDDKNHLRIAVFQHLQRVANGDTLDDALFAAAKSLNVKLWNEQ